MDRLAPGTPPAPLLALAARLETAGIAVALGGSGLLLALGLLEPGQVRDWDLTTDAPWDRVRPELDLAALPWQDAHDPGSAYASAFRVVVRPTGADNVEGPEVDLIGGFAVHAPAGPVRLPVLPGPRWHGLPLASPTVWFAAYRLMARPAKADLLLAHLRRRGADPAALHRLLAEPLPADLRRDVAALAGAR